MTSHLQQTLLARPVCPPEQVLVSQQATSILSGATRCAGFTLIEVLVVVFIIGIMSAMVTLSINIGDPSDPQGQLDQIKERLLDLSLLAEDQAVLTGEPIGILISPPEDDLLWRYDWLRYRGGQWVEASEPLTGKQLPENIELTLEVDGELVDFSKLKDEAENDEENPEIPPPSVVFYPGGEITNFVLTLFDAAEVDQQVILTSLRIGRVEWLTPEELQELW